MLTNLHRKAQLLTSHECADWTRRGRFVGNPSERSSSVLE